ncbi:hypothetical protein NLD30_05405 [SCandidatus Aminicenantes bacterium Aminicenantia_JdfR_composite]|jgi:hypothetical protein|nr:hypothetical protein [SCandidatus Aminicenantes bacterium Aminicenantia_JdfR_composite]MCP2598551.1 hypothetical protein [Candidatus Aminicenantes bacterium AC-335-L06]
MKKFLTFLLIVSILCVLLFGLFQIIPEKAIAGEEETLCPTTDWDCFKIGDPCKKGGSCVCTFYLFCIVKEEL